MRNSPATTPFFKEELNKESNEALGSRLYVLWIYFLRAYRLKNSNQLESLEMVWFFLRKFFGLGIAQFTTKIQSCNWTANKI